MIQFQSISKTYIQDGHSTEILKDISFNIPEGDIFGLIGESGAGKTSLLKILLQLEEPSLGIVLVDGKDLRTKQDRQAFRMMSATVFQEANLIHNKTCYENVLLPLKLRKEKDLGQVKQALAFVGLQGFEKRYPATLSGGEKQRLSIARALVTNPKILICDEPTAALDYQSTQIMRNLLLNIQKTYGTTIVLVSHDLSFAQSVCQQIALIDQGQLASIYKVSGNHHPSSPKTYKDYVEEMFQ